jgi:hypothetical protein
MLGRGPADSLAYIEFRAVAPSVRPFCIELERRATDAKACALLVECQESYVSTRRTVMLPCVQANFATLGALPDLAKAAVEGASYLTSLAQMETQVLEKHCGVVCFT